MPKSKSSPSRSDIKTRGITSIQFNDDFSMMRLTWLDHKKKEIHMQVPTTALEHVMPLLVAQIKEAKRRAGKQRAFVPIEVSKFGADLDEYNNPIVRFDSKDGIPFNFRLDLGSGEKLHEVLGHMLEAAKNRPPPTKQ